MFRTVVLCPSSGVHTVHTAISICHTGYADCLLASSQYNLYDIYLLLCVQCWTPDYGQSNCPKHMEFYSKNKFEKLVHLVGFIIRMITFLCFFIPLCSYRYYVPRFLCVWICASTAPYSFMVWV